MTAAKRGGWFDRTDALAAGYSDTEIRSRVRAGRWVRLCRGAYAELRPGEESLANWDRVQWRHLRAAKAVYHRLGGRAVVSHQSALLLHGLEAGGLDLTRIHVTRLTGHGRADASVVQHSPRPEVVDPVEVGGVLATPGPRSVVEAIRYARYPIAVSVVDEALRKVIASRDQLADALALFAGRVGIGTANRAVEFGDGRSESVGESRLRVLLSDLGLPPPIPQVEIRDESARLIGRVDFLLERWGLIIEFDGVLKYGGRTSAALVAEKAREDRLRDLGYEVVRVIWAELAQPAEVVRRIRLAIRRSSARRAPIAGSATAAGL
ncbi:type IV toxin-antitoxin system AbiEi family antitoxin domain-containing protein [Kribbella sancticallisti]|uniref:Type IV toxin-antitoxin system AbiEi family antitoxin domain-containing protein n=2 Tax=Kribbella sancticallisti TaxID=460087 RepID=A0ABP4P9U0_9ACTN